MTAGFIDLPSDAFPMTCWLFAASDPEGTTPLWTVTVDGPGAFEVPALAQQIGQPVWARIQCGNGEIIEEYDEGVRG